MMHGWRWSSSPPGPADDVRVSYASGKAARTKPLELDREFQEFLTKSARHLACLEIDPTIPPHCPAFAVQLPETRTLL
jgi:hypothetical protein